MAYNLYINKIINHNLNKSHQTKQDITSAIPTAYTHH